MKFKSLTAALALSAVALQANALDPAGPFDLEFTVSGATAADKQFANYITQICDAATLDTFNNPADTASAFTCTVRNGSVAGISGDRDVLIRKESGGSSTGVEPVTNATTVVGLNLSTCSETTANQWTCSDTTINVNAQVGISDVEPELFAIPANGNKNVNLSAPLSVFPVNAQTFGIVATPDLRDALQAAQGLTVGSDDVSQMPSLSSTIIANLFAGNISSWSQLQTATGAAIAVNSNDVEVCVRTPGSGTQAQFNAFYMKDACAYRGAGDFGFQGLATSTDGNGISNDIVRPELFPGFPAPAPYTHQNNGSSDMGRCLTNLAAAGRTALGIQSLEKVDEGRTNRNNFRYLAIDGVTPTLENVAAGLYHNWATLSIQWRNDVVTGDLLDLANQLVQTAQEVSAVRTFNLSLQDDDPSTTNDDRAGNRADGFRNPEILDGGVPANVGTLALATASTAPASPWSETVPVIPFNKGLVGPSACAVPRINGPVDVSNVN